MGGGAGPTREGERPGLVTRYIAFLRAINVGGRTVAMERLREILGQAGLARVGTYIQSGNAFFESAESRDDLALRLEALLAKELGFATEVCLRSAQQVAEAIEGSPFRGAMAGLAKGHTCGPPVPRDERFCIVFTRAPIPETVVPVSAPRGDLEVVAVRREEAYVRWRLIDGRPPTSSSNAWLNKLLGSPSTSRFLHTTEKILAAALKDSP